MEEEGKLKFNYVLTYTFNNDGDNTGDKLRDLFITYLKGKENARPRVSFLKDDIDQSTIAFNAPIGGIEVLLKNALKSALAELRKEDKDAKYVAGSKLFILEPTLFKDKVHSNDKPYIDVKDCSSLFDDVNKSFE